MHQENGSDGQAHGGGAEHRKDEEHRKDDEHRKDGDHRPPEPPGRHVKPRAPHGGGETYKFLGQRS